jgi:hypothetical protein
VCLRMLLRLYSLYSHVDALIRPFTLPLSLSLSHTHTHHSRIIAPEDQSFFFTATLSSTLSSEGPPGARELSFLIKVCVCVCVCMYVCVYVCMEEDINICGMTSKPSPLLSFLSSLPRSLSQASTHSLTYTFIYTHIHTHTYTHIVRPMGRH